MRVAELKPSGRVAGRWLAVLEDGSILRVGEGEVIDFALCAGKELTEEETTRLLAAARFSTLRERAITHLAAKPLSRRELARKLTDWGAQEDEGERICDRMEELGFLNDADYALRVVRHYAAKGYGERKLRDELYRRGVPRALWDDALSRADDPGAFLNDYLRRHLPEDCADRAQLKKITDALARRGFGWEEISDALNRRNVPCDD